MPPVQVKNYILVHGAWHGSWCWSKVSSHLQKLGQNVIVPDLPGHHHHKYDFKDISLKTYVDHIESIIHKSPNPVVLVGHSMAGVVITQVAENMPDKIAHLIYVSGFIPQNKGSLLDEEKQASIPSVASLISINVSDCSISLPLSSFDPIRALFYAHCNDEDAHYALSRLQSQPLRPFADKISISEARFGLVKKLYIECLQDQAILLQDQRRMHAKIKCDVVAIDTDHSPFFSADQHLSSLIYHANMRNNKVC